MDVRDEVAVSGVWGRRDEATIRNELGREFACSENIDLQIGRVLDKLEALGELDDTWIVYTADHGMAIGRHGLQGKQNLYEHTWRVPLIVAGPGVKAGSRAPGNVYLADVLATLCEIAGIEPPATNEGTSFVPVLTGKQPVIRDVLYGVYCGGAKPGIRSVRQDHWKLVKYESPAGGLVTQLFDLRANPEEFLGEHHDPAVTAVSSQPVATSHSPWPLLTARGHFARRRCRCPGEAVGSAKGWPVPIEPALRTSAGRMPKRSSHGASGGRMPERASGEMARVTPRGRLPRARCPRPLFRSNPRGSLPRARCPRPLFGRSPGET